MIEFIISVSPSYFVLYSGRIRSFLVGNLTTINFNSVSLLNNGFSLKSKNIKTPKTKVSIAWAMIISLMHDLTFYCQCHQSFFESPAFKHKIGRDENLNAWWLTIAMSPLRVGQYINKWRWCKTKFARPVCPGRLSSENWT